MDGYEQFDDGSRGEIVTDWGIGWMVAWGPRPSQLGRVEAELEIPAGRVQVSWTKGAGSFSLHVHPL